MTYDPTMPALLDQCENDWGDQVVNAERLIPYGLKPIDLALYGIDPDGEVILIQGDRKGRKTTTEANIIKNIMTGKKPVEKPVINIDTLESGMRPKTYRDVFISMMATQYLMFQGHKPYAYCPACNAEACHQIGITPKFLRYNKRTKEQQEAISWAIDNMRTWPLLIHGANVLEGNTRSLTEAALGTKKEKARWKRLMDAHGVSIFVVDHLQQYAFETAMDDYEKQIRAVSQIGDFSTQNGVTFMLLSQVSMGSLKDAKENGGKLTAAGGSRAAAEATTVFSTSQTAEGRVVKLKIEESRYTGSFSVWQRIEIESGLFYGNSETEPIMA